MSDFEHHAHWFTHVWARPGQPTIIDFANAEGVTLHFKKTPEQMRAEHPTAQFRLFDEWKTEMHARENPPVTWVFCSKRVFDNALTALPPAATKDGAFLMGEEVDHFSLGSFPRFWAYREGPAGYEQSSRPMTIREFNGQPPLEFAGGAAPASAQA